MYPCQTFEDVQMKAMTFVRLEEDEDQEQGATKRVERRNNGAQRSAQRSTPYSRPSAVNAASERSRKDTALTSYPDVHTYNFNVSIDELIKVLEGMR